MQPDTVRFSHFHLLFTSTVLFQSKNPSFIEFYNKIMLLSNVQSVLGKETNRWCQMKTAKPVL